MHRRRKQAGLQRAMKPQACKENTAHKKHRRPRGPPPRFTHRLHQSICDRTLTPRNGVTEKASAKTGALATSTSTPYPRSLCLPGSPARRGTWSGTGRRCRWSSPSGRRPWQRRPPAAASPADCGSGERVKREVSESRPQLCPPTTPHPIIPRTRTTKTPGLQ